MTDRDSQPGRRAFLTFLAAMAAAGVALSACVGAVLWALDGTKLLDFGFTDDRPRLDPIPIPKTACPFVEVIHGEANRFQQSYANARFSLYAHDANAPWTAQKQELDDAARTLDFALAIGAPTFPPRITRHLTRARDALQQGRTLLATTTSHEQLLRVDGTFRDGQEQFGYASDLVGHQCAVPLRANSYTMLPSSTATAPATGPAPP